MVSLPIGRNGRSGKTGRSHSPMASEDRIAGWIFIAPAFLVLLTFIFGPIVFSAWVSLHDWDTIGQFGQAPDRPFVGLENYRELFDTPAFWQSARNTVWYTVGVVPLQTTFALLLAILANRKLRGISFFRTAFYFPSISSSVVIAVIFLWLYSGNGLINSVLRDIGIDPPRPVWLANPNGVFELLARNFGVEIDNAWLVGPSVALLSIMLQNVWSTLGSLMVVYLAGLQNVPNEVYEAASLDGATRWRQFRDITIPLLRPITFFVVTIGMIGCFQVFDQIFIMSSGGPAGTTTTLAYFVYTQGFGGLRQGFGSAAAIVLFFVILFVYFVQRRVIGQNDTD